MLTLIHHILTHRFQKDNDVLAVTWSSSGPHGGITLNSVVAKAVGGDTAVTIEQGNFTVRLEGGETIDSAAMTLEGTIVSRQVV